MQGRPSNKSGRVVFALEKNRDHVLRKSSEECRSTWYGEEDIMRFRRNALRDAQFYRYIRYENAAVDLIQFEDQVCSWGLEKNISHRTAMTTNELKKRVAEAVLASQQQGHVKSPNDKHNESIVKKLNKYSSERARKFGVFREKRAREMIIEDN